MKKVLMSFAAIALMVGFSVSVMGQTTVPTKAYANIIKQITIEKQSDLVFGYVALSGASSGTCEINAVNGNRIAGSGLVLSDKKLSSGTIGPATFKVTGEPDVTYFITIPTVNVPLTKLGGATPLGLSLLKDTDTVANGLEGYDGTLSEQGGDNFRVGGTLTVPVNCEIGSYEGSFNVSVDYN